MYPARAVRQRQVLATGASDRRRLRGPAPGVLLPTGGVLRLTAVTAIRYRPATTTPAVQPGARPSSGGVSRPTSTPARDEHEGDQRVGVPHVTGAELVASPRRGGEVVDGVQSSAWRRRRRRRRSWHLRQPRRGQGSRRPATGAPRSGRSGNVPAAGGRQARSPATPSPSVSRSPRRSHLDGVPRPGQPAPPVRRGRSAAGGAARAWRPAPRRGDHSSARREAVDPAPSGTQ